VAVLLVFLLFGIMEFGMMFSSSITVTQAANQGARAAALKGDRRKVEAAVYGAAQTLKSGSKFDFASGNVIAEYKPFDADDWRPWDPNSAPPDGQNDQIRITVRYPYKYMTGSLLGKLGNSLRSSDGAPAQPADQRIIQGVAVMRYGY
jgi:hypothetical protein